MNGVNESLRPAYLQNVTVIILNRLRFDGVLHFTWGDIWEMIKQKVGSASQADVLTALVQHGAIKPSGRFFGNRMGYCAGDHTIVRLSADTSDAATISVLPLRKKRVEQPPGLSEADYIMISAAVLCVLPHEDGRRISTVRKLEKPIRLNRPFTAEDLVGGHPALCNEQLIAATLHRLVAEGRPGLRLAKDGARFVWDSQAACAARNERVRFVPNVSLQNDPFVQSLAHAEPQEGLPKSVRSKVLRALNLLRSVGKEFMPVDVYEHHVGASKLFVSASAAQQFVFGIKRLGWVVCIKQEVVGSTQYNTLRFDVTAMPLTIAPNSVVV